MNLGIDYHPSFKICNEYYKLVGCEPFRCNNCVFYVMYNRKSIALFDRVLEITT